MIFLTHEIALLLHVERQLFAGKDLLDQRRLGLEQLGLALDQDLDAAGDALATSLSRT